MKLTTILVTRSGSCHVKTLHTVLRNNIQSVQRSDVQSQIVFVNDDPYEKASSIENHMKTSDRILFVDFGIHLDDGSLSTVYNPNETYNVIVFPGVKEGIDWDMFKDKISNNSKENIYINAIHKNKSPYTKNYITYKDIMNGSVFSTEMSSEPNMNLGVGESSKPYSASQD